MTPRLRTRLVFALYFLGLALVLPSLLGHVTVPGLKWVAIVLILLPALDFVFWNDEALGEKRVLASVAVGLLPLLYVYYLRFAYPVGFSDTPIHMLQTENLFNDAGVIDFSRAQSVPFSFVALYVEGRVAELVSGLDIVGVASMIPPLLNLGMLLVAYAIVKRITNPRVAMIALVLLGWENNTLVFGDQYRTQGLGNLFTLGALLVYLVQSRGQKRLPAISAVGLLFLLSLSATAFVSVIFAIWFFGGAILMDYLTKMPRWTQRPSHFLIMNVFVLAYVFYISASAGSFIGAFVILLMEAFSPSTVTLTIGGQEIYGPVVRWFTYGFWALSAAFAVLLMKWGILRDRSGVLTVLAGLAAVFGFATIASTLLPFSAGRGYTLGALLIGIVIPVGVYRAEDVISRRRHRSLRTVACVIVVLFVMVSIAKLPSYVGSDMFPIRDPEFIDRVAYWRVDPTDFSAGLFLEKHGSNQVLYLHMLVAPYMILALYREGLKEPPGFNQAGEVAPGSLVLLRDKVQGKDYGYRGLLPPVSVYDGFSMVYSNGDYLLYSVPSS